MRKKLKVVLHCQASRGKKDSFYGNDGFNKHEIESKFNSEIEYYGFGGHLTGENLENFKKECSDADVIITDAWTHTAKEARNRASFLAGTVGSAQLDMADIVREIQQVNPLAFYFANLTEGLVDVHKYAQPIESWNDDKIIQALNQKLIEKECEHADVVIATAHPPYESWKSKSKDPHRRRDFYNDSGNTWLKKIAHIFMYIQKRNPTAFYFASLFQGKALKQKQIEKEKNHE